MLRKPKTEESAKTKASEKTAKAPGAMDAQGAVMNRETKRMMKRREGAADRLKRQPAAKRTRTKPTVFLKEVRGELARVAWPSRQEVITYSVVVLMTVIFFMMVIGGIDFVALKVVLFIIGLGGK